MPLDLSRVAHRRPASAARRERASSPAGEARPRRASRVPFEASLAGGAPRAARASAPWTSLQLAPLAEGAPGARAEPSCAAPSRTSRAAASSELELSWPAGREAGRRAPASRAPRSTVGSASRLEDLLGGSPLRRRRARGERRALAPRRPAPPDPRRAPRRPRPGARVLRAPLRRAGAGEQPARPASPRRLDRRATKEGEPPSWKRLRARGRLDRAPGAALRRGAAGRRGDARSGRSGLRVALERAVWAGVPIRGTASYRARARGGGELRIDMGPPFEPSQPELHRGAWARGRFDFETTSLGSLEDAGRLGLLPRRRDAPRPRRREAPPRPGPDCSMPPSTLDLSGRSAFPSTSRPRSPTARSRTSTRPGAGAEAATGSLSRTARISASCAPGGALGAGDAPATSRSRRATA